MTHSVDLLNRSQPALVDGRGGSAFGRVLDPMSGLLCSMTDLYQ
jgi:hypothetical protein